MIRTITITFDPRNIEEKRQILGFEEVVRSLTKVLFPSSTVEGEWT